MQFATQLLILTIGKILFVPVTKRYTKNIDATIKNQPYLIVGNHQRALDPFVIICGLPYKHALRLLPIGFMTANFFYDSFIRPLCWIAGCFPARNPKGKHTIFGVDGASILLNSGFSIFIFPEGKRMRDGSRGPAHHGVTRIHEQASNIPLLLCHIKYNNGLKALFSGKRFEIVYNLSKKQTYKSPELLMDELFAL